MQMRNKLYYFLALNIFSPILKYENGNNHRPLGNQNAVSRKDPTR